MAKYFFQNEDDEHCFTKNHFIELMKETGEKEMNVFVAKPLTDDQYFFCKAVGECGERGHCGKECDDYEPRNGKSGCCKHFGKLYEAMEKTVIKVR